MFDYIQGDKYVQADISVEDKDYPNVEKYKRAEVCVKKERERDRQRQRQTDKQTDRQTDKRRQRVINLYIFLRYIQGLVG